MGRAHHFSSECGGCIADQCDMVAELHCEARCRFDTCVSKEPHEDDMSDAVLLELHVEVSIGKSALPPVLMGDDITVSRREINVKLTAPASLRKRMPAHDALLGRIDVLPALVVAGFPLAMRNDEDTNAGSSDG